MNQISIPNIPTIKRWSRPTLAAGALSHALAFADHVDYLVAGQRAPGSPKRTETLAGVNPALDGPVVLLQDIIEDGTGRCWQPESNVPSLHRIRPTISVADTVLKQRLGKEQRAAAGFGPDSGGELSDAIYRKVSQAWQDGIK